ncbi:GNAT family N-acetyltransferase [Halomonas dongshanensis]|uniref:GNAT family N-acetyltransferase n=1 Tax=Halomonas dongshanensis TaxID=2890835 RepID=UPI0031F42CAD
MRLSALDASHLAALVALEGIVGSGVSDHLLSGALNSSTNHVLGLFVDDALVGYALIARQPFDAELQAIGVAPGRRGMGLGVRLMAGVIEIAQAWQSERLLLEVRASNTAAQALYRRFDFSQDGRRKGYYAAPGLTGEREDAVLMSRGV